MTRKMLLALAIFAASATPALAGDADGRISGRLVDIRPDGKLIIEEQGPWKGPGTGLVTRAIELTPGTSIRVLRPTGTWGPNDAVPGYEVQEGDFRALKAGDFVTVSTGGGSSVAASVDVMRPEGDTGMASPRFESGKP